jgi:hypothetical protein
MKIKTAALLAASMILFSCNNSKTDDSTKAPDSLKQTVTDRTTTSMPDTNTATAASTKIFIDGKESDLGGSLLVQKDKNKLQPGNDYMVMLTAPNPNPSAHEALVLNFLLALKSGTYPVVGMSYHRGESPHNEMYGGVLGGQPKLTSYKVNITECKDLGANSMGGHKWSISGDFTDLTIPAMPVMLMDKTKNHPAEIKIEKGSFSNLTFDDNWEEMMKKASEVMQKK